jgi:hypothetical protein
MYNHSINSYYTLIYVLEEAAQKKGTNIDPKKLAVYQISIHMMEKFHEVSKLQGSQCVCNIALRHVCTTIISMQKP